MIFCDENKPKRFDANCGRKECSLGFVETQVTWSGKWCKADEVLPIIERLEELSWLRQGEYDSMLSTWQSENRRMVSLLAVIERNYPSDNSPDGLETITIPKHVWRTLQNKASRMDCLQRLTQEWKK